VIRSEALMWYILGFEDAKESPAKMLFSEHWEERGKEEERNERA